MKHICLLTLPSHVTHTHKSGKTRTGTRAAGLPDYNVQSGLRLLDKTFFSASVALKCFAWTF